MHEDNDTKVYAVSGGKLRISATGGEGFSLTPLPGNVGGYPLVATPDEDEARNFRIAGPDFTTQLGPIGKLDVDVAAGGGRDGDKWRLTLAPSKADTPLTSMLRGRDGEVLTRPAGVWHIARVAGDTVEPFMPVLADDGAARWYFTAEQSFTKDALPRAVDVSRFSQLCLYMLLAQHEEQDSPVRPFIELCWEPTGNGLLVYAGTPGNIGAGFNASALIVTGAREASVEDGRAFDTRRMPYARFGFETAGAARETAFATEAHFYALAY